MTLTATVVPDAPDYMATLLQLGQLLNSSLDLKQVLETAIEQVIRFVGAERGFILLVDIETGRVWGEAVRNIERALWYNTTGGFAYDGSFVRIGRHMGRDPGADARLSGKAQDLKQSWEKHLP